MDIIYRNNPAKHQLDGILSSMILNQDLVQIKLHDVTTKKNPYQVVHPETTPKMEK